MENDELKKIYFLVMGVLLMGTFLIILTSPPVTQGYVVKGDVSGPSYEMVSCIDDLAGTVRAGYINKQTGRREYSTLERKYDASSGLTTYYRCSGLKIVSYQA